MKNNDKSLYSNLNIRLVALTHEGHWIFQNEKVLNTSPSENTLICGSPRLRSVALQFGSSLNMFQGLSLCVLSLSLTTINQLFTPSFWTSLYTQFSCRSQGRPTALLPWSSIPVFSSESHSLFSSWCALPIFISRSWLSTYQETYKEIIYLITGYYSPSITIINWFKKSW